MLSSPMWGAFADRHGRKPMLIRATLGGALMVVLMGFAQNAEQLVLIRSVQGLLTGVVSATSALVAASRPKEKSGESLGLIQTGIWVGVAVGPLIGGLVSEAFGYRASFWITGAALALAGVCSHFLCARGVLSRRRCGTASTSGRAIATCCAPPICLHSIPRFSAKPGPLGHNAGHGLLFRRTAALGRGSGCIHRTEYGRQAAVGSVSAVFLGRLSDRVGYEKVVVFGAVMAVLVYLRRPSVVNAWQLLFFQA